MKLKPNGAGFVDNLNVLDCSKVSDGASAIAVCLGRRTETLRDTEKRSSGGHGLGP